MPNLAPGRQLRSRIWIDYTGQASATDNCSFAPGTGPATAPLLAITQMPTTATLMGDGDAETVTLTATDAAGNSANCTFTVTAEDDTAPAITCPADQTRALNANCIYELENLTGLATTSDNCPGTIDVTQSPLPDAVAFIGSNSQAVTLTATDPAGNTSTCTFTVNAIDATPPTISCPMPVTLDVNGACEARVPDLTDDATADDNCNAVVSVTVTQDLAANTLLTGAGTTRSVTLTATDEAGLTATCQVTVTLDDVTPPTVICPAAQELESGCYRLRGRSCPTIHMHLLTACG